MELVWAIYNGVLAKMMWAECKPLLRVTVLKSSFSFYEELGGHVFQRTQTEDGKASRLTSDDGMSENTHLLYQVIGIPAFITAGPLLSNSRGQIRDRGAR